ncbi:hypothetical protein AVEN_246735-1 [Araneus ventricosus]|uniref:C2H2-type domain-containing protein n=1 Tax=Araneus ventricosus TaxID=182803 RepID=A0A4Y2K978_ARAVE|nr:hypothetical protein AVEN_246735-1 [Araneus ventricosus]
MPFGPVNPIDTPYGQYVYNLCTLFTMDISHRDQENLTEAMIEMLSYMFVREHGMHFLPRIVIQLTWNPSCSELGVCDVCKKTFSRKDNLKRHMKKHGDHVNHACSQCNMKFYRVDKLQEHIRTHTREKKTHPCEHCDQVFPRMSDLLRHKRTDHSAPPAPRIAAAPRARNSRLNALGVYSSHFMTPTPAGKWDLILFFEEVRPQIHDMIASRRLSSGTVYPKYASAGRPPTEMWSISRPTSEARWS